MQLHELQKKFSGRELLKAELESLYQNANELNARLRREKLNLEYEQSDVESLEGHSFKSFFYTAIGKKEERLMKEEDEAAEAERQYEETQKSLEQINARIKRIELELKKLEWAERDYKKLVENMSARLEAIASVMSGDDIDIFSAIQKELSKQQQKQVYYNQIAEECNELQKRIDWVAQALREAEEEREKRNYGRYGGCRRNQSEQERIAEAQERRQAALVQEQRIQDLINKVLDDEADRRESLKSNNLISKSRLARLSENVAGNLHGILEEVAKRTQFSKSRQALLESRLSELVQKYQAM